MHFVLYEVCEANAMLNVSLPISIMIH